VGWIRIRRRRGSGGERRRLPAGGEAALRGYKTAAGRVKWHSAARKRWTPSTPPAAPALLVRQRVLEVRGGGDAISTQLSGCQPAAVGAPRRVRGANAGQFRGASLAWRSRHYASPDRELGRLGAEARAARIVGGSESGASVGVAERQEGRRRAVKPLFAATKRRPPSRPCSPRGVGPQCEIGRLRRDRKWGLGRRGRGSRGLLSKRLGAILPDHKCVIAKVNLFGRNTLLEPEPIEPTFGALDGRKSQLSAGDKFRDLLA
jgi:hypothetical protein